MIGSDAKHCEGGPTLLLNELNDFSKYKKYLTPVEFISSMNIQYYLFLSRPAKSIPKLDLKKYLGSIYGILSLKEMDSILKILRGTIF
ncbi:hypothetical protein ALNOE001_14900 [Candidatus Methanobinarius endosymbioticus]|uniref:Uncharacterized protein n=1 Tax=Candidatus Methanobinarius endosymbioticus TaxID=2006182 RepID=A0A366M9S7_9EURY|nr:hypothetical protein ALNOE001_14900 [Candidatus Methanobinarius endosymbioticus]